jgi:hypothetical protein
MEASQIKPGKFVTVVGLDSKPSHPNLCKAGCGSETSDASGTCPWCQKKALNKLEPYPKDYQSC